MKPVLTRLTFTLCLLLALALAAAAAPRLAPLDGQPLPTEAQLHEPLEFSLSYQGDPPTGLFLVVLTPDGETVRVPAKASAGDPAAGVPVTWPYTPTESGLYHYHFEAAAGDIGGVRYPDAPAPDLQLVVANPLMRYLVLGIGLLICFLFLPFVSYTATRSLNQRGDPAAAARIALLIGLVAYIGLAISVLVVGLGSLLWLGLALAGVVVLAILVGLFTRRRAV